MINIPSELPIRQQQFSRLFLIAKKVLEYLMLISLLSSLKANSKCCIVFLVYDYTPWVPGQIPPPLDEFVEFTPSLQQYKPILWLNDYWSLRRDYMPINR